MARFKIKERMERFFEDMDYFLLIPVLLLTVIGLYVMNLVMQSGYGAGEYPSNFIKQFGAAIFGMFLALIICLIEPPTLKLMAWFVYAASIVLLLVVRFDGYSLAALTGADSWLMLPLIGSFQPSELAKIGIAMVSSHYFCKMKEGELDYKKGFAMIFLVFAIPILFIYRQPDFGTALVIVVMFATMLFVWGLDWKYILGLSLGAFALFAFLWNFSFSPYMKNRILSLVFPDQDLTEGYHLEQALQAIAMGGISGKQSDATAYVPVKESDFIYSAVSEYLGMIGTTSLIILISIFIIRAIYLAYKVQEMDYYGSYLMMGLTAVMAFHFIENMGMNVGLLPITGIPLPFLSSGGTAMVVNYFSLGLMLNISMEYKSYKS